MSLNYMFFNHTHYINKLYLLLQLLPNIVILNDYFFLYIMHFDEL